MQKIFFNQSLFILTDNEAMANYYSLTHRYRSKKKLFQFIAKQLASPQPFTAYIFQDNLPSLEEKFYSYFKIKEAAGGIVKKGAGILAIYKRCLWDLPKGHLDPGETLEACAIREVHEECKLPQEHLQIHSTLQTTRHIFLQQRRFVIKYTHWYLMEYTGSQEPKPLKSEGIKEVRWFHPEELEFFLSNTHASIHELVRNTERLRKKAIQAYGI